MKISKKKKYTFNYYKIYLNKLKINFKQIEHIIN